MKTGQRGPLPPNRWSFDNIKQKIGEQVLENNVQAHKPEGGAHLRRESSSDNIEKLGWNHF